MRTGLMRLRLGFEEMHCGLNCLENKASDSMLG